jgi:Arc/MetJ-type ribon-helix-helix transcriptional regulator
MAIELDPKIEDRIEEEVASGRFASAQELVSIAVQRYLQHCDDDLDLTTEEVQAAIDEGLRDAAEGRLIDEEEFRRRVEELKASLPARANA